MRLYEFVNIAEVRQQTTLLYHGTSSVFVRSILKQGLNPNPDKRSWGNVEKVGAGQVSLPGVYLTPIPRYATTAASQSVEVNGGDPVLITVQYVEGSGGIDEDNIISTIGYTIGNYIGGFSDKGVDEYQEILDIIKSELVSMSTNRRSFEILKKLVMVGIKIAKNHPDEIQSLKFDVMYADPTFRALLQQFTESVKMFPSRGQGYDSEDSIGSNIENVKVTRPITYRGKTRIVKIENLRTKQVYYSTL